MNEQEYSKRLGVITDEQFQRALHRFDLGELVKTEMITAGLFGQNVFLTSTTGEYVFRGVPHYNDQFPREQFFARWLHLNTTVPAPWPYLIDESPDIFGWSYAIMPRLQGIDITDETVRKQLSEQDLLAIDYAIGKSLAELQKAKWPTCGTYELSTETIAAIPTDYFSWVKAEILGWIDKAKMNSDQTTAEDEKWVAELLDDAMPALQEPFQPTFVMRDYKPGNFLVQNNEGKWHVSGLFDLMECYFGDGEADLSRITAMYIEQGKLENAVQFIKGYANQMNSPRDGFRERFAVYMLWDRLIIWEYGQRESNQWWNNVTLREWAEPFMRPSFLELITDRQGV